MSEPMNDAERRRNQLGIVEIVSLYDWKKDRKSVV